jgi:formate dehydrogenase major subunit
MSDRKEITLTINGNQVKGKEGDTVLEVCRANNIYVPTLCFLEGLSTIGACRLCVVEIQGERRINPSCTYPARDGLVVTTHTPNLEKYRRLILELIFTERNHFCFFCAASGDCELQSQAYRYQMDHARYPYTFPALPTDTLNDFLVIDHNRCILCGRCVRVCGEVVGDHTLDFSRRGWRTLVVADLNQSLGQSSCISCGACLQACPTGAIFSKVSAYRGRTSEGKITRSACSLCGVGCETDVLVKDNNIVRIDGANLTGLKGQLCLMGRFQQVYNETPRVTTPLIRNKKGNLEPASWEDASKLISDKIKDYKARQGASSIAGLVSSLCPSETLEAFSKFMRNTVGTSYIDTLDGSSYRTIAEGISAFSKNGQGLRIESSLESILDADCVLVVGSNPLESHPVAGCYILRAKTQKKASIIVVDSRPNTFGFRADIWLRPNAGSEEALLGAMEGLVAKKAKSTEKEMRFVSLAKAVEVTGLDKDTIQKASAMLSAAKNPVVVYGEGVFAANNSKLVARVLDLAKVASHDGLKVISLKPRGNSRGAWELGIASRNGMAKAKPKMIYVLMSDDKFEMGDWAAPVDQAEFVVVQASYRSPLTDCADVVLPSPIWAERKGKYVSLDGKVGNSHKVVEPPSGIKDDVEVISKLAKGI